MSVIDRASEHRFEIHLDGQLAGFITYREAGDTLVLLHTEVVPERRGKGVGGRLAGGALQLVRERGQQVVLQCGFLIHYVETHPQEADVLAN